MIAWWIVYSVLMATAFSSSLIAHLTQESSEPPVDTPEDIVKRGLVWGLTFKQAPELILNLEVKIAFNALYKWD